MMTLLDVEKINQVLDAMMQCEQKLAELYGRCAETWAADAAFWTALSEAEVGHGENIQRMKEILKSKRERFEIGRPFNVIALNQIISGIDEYRQRVDQGKVNAEEMLFIARDIEQSVLESRYAELLKTTDMDYTALVRNVVSQTVEHKRSVQEKINSRKMS